MIIHSDWHMHSQSSYDSTLRIEEIIQKTSEYGFFQIGITDHVNFNDNKFLSDLRNSADDVKKYQMDHSHIVLGVELTPIEKPEFDYIQKNGTRDGYIPPVTNTPFQIELAQTKEQLMEYGVRYAIGGTHWRVDVPYARSLAPDLDTMIKEWYRMQMWLATDERVTVLGHPWYNCDAVWYDDFSVIPHSMNMDIAAALKENKKYVECNAGFLFSPKVTDKFRRQYAEFLRELFEMGIPVTYGSDSHNTYSTMHFEIEKLLSGVGFVDGDISGISESDLW